MTLHLAALHLRWPRLHLPRRHAVHWWTPQRRSALTLVGRLGGVRPEFGADEQWAEDLRVIRRVLRDSTGRVSLVRDDVTTTGFTSLRGQLADDTAPFDWLDRLDAVQTFVATLRAAGQWPGDATEIALTAAVRQAGGAA